MSPHHKPGSNFNDDDRNKLQYKQILQLCSIRPNWALIVSKSICGDLPSIPHLAICKTLFYSFILPQLKTFPSSSSTPGQQYHSRPLEKCTNNLPGSLFQDYLPNSVNFLLVSLFSSLSSIKTRSAVWPYVRLVLSLTGTSIYNNDVLLSTTTT